MYQGKRCNHKINRKFQKSALLLVSIVALVTAALGGTLAYLFTNTDAVENTFTPVKVTTEVDEDFNGSVKSDVTIKNTGDIDAYIRAAVVINWQTKEGKVYGEAPVETTDYTISYNTTNWTESGGFWYHKGAVASGKETNVLINECKPTEAGQSRTLDNETYYLTVTILGSAVQAKPDDVVTTVWGNVPVK